MELFGMGLEDKRADGKQFVRLSGSMAFPSLWPWAKQNG
jgi:hypothetical protein